MKVLVNVYVPAIAQGYDVLVPDDMRIRNVVSLIVGAVTESSSQLYVPSGEECLCSVEKNILLRANATLDKYGIQNGDHLILM
jgi:uncharacterized ubiquitin-like protein YukD